MKCWWDDLTTVNMNVEEACRIGKDTYDCEMEFLWNVKNRRTLRK